MPQKEGKRKAPALPPKPSTVTEEQWVLAHSAAKLVELLAAPDSNRGASAGSKAAEHGKSSASKQTAALWLWQLVSTSPDAREEAFKAGAVEVCAKLIGGHGSSSASSAASTHNHSRSSAGSADAHQALLAYSLATLTQLAAPSSAVREALMTARPLVLPALLSHLAEASSTSLIAAAIGLLAVLAGCPDTHSRVKKLLASWDKAPLVAALTSEHSLPLVGGRHAAADAAAVLQAVCSPMPPPGLATAAAGEAGSNVSSKDGGGKAEGSGGKESSSSGKGSATATGAAASGDAAADATLTVAVQEGVLAAGGLQGLLKACKAGNPVAARSAAVSAACHLMAAHGRKPQVKDEFRAAGGVTTVLQLLPAQQLPLQVRAAAAGCIWHYLSPLPSAADHTVGSGGQASTPATAAAGSEVPSGVFGLPSPLDSPLAALSRPLTALGARNNLPFAARSARRQQTQQVQVQASSGSSLSSGSTSNSGGRASMSMSGATGSSSSPGSSSSGSISKLPGSAAAAAAVAGPASVAGFKLTDEQQAHTAAAAAAASYQASVAVWDDAIAHGDLAARAEHVLAAGCVPVLLLLCCGPDGPPAALAAAANLAAAAAATGDATSSRPAAGVGGPDGPAKPASSGSSSTTTAGLAEGPGSFMSRAAGSSSARGTRTDLGAIAEPSHGETEESDDAMVPTSAAGDGASTALDDEDGGGSSRDSSAKEGASADKKKKAGKNKGGKLEPGMAEAQVAASAAVKLLAMSGEEGRAALLAAGAQRVLVPLLAGPATEARWNARQGLMLLALTTKDAGQPAARLSNSKLASSNGSGAEAQGLPASALAAAAAAGAGSASRTAEEVPAYITMGNMPASHWQRSAPLQMPPLPALPVIPSRRPAGTEQHSSGLAAPGGAAGGSAGPLPGRGSGGSSGVQPASQQRRTSMSSTAGGAMTASSRVSSNSSGMVGDVAATAAAVAGEGTMGIPSKLGKNIRASVVVAGGLSSSTSGGGGGMVLGG